MDQHVSLALVLERQFPGRSSILSKRLVLLFISRGPVSCFLGDYGDIHIVFHHCRLIIEEVGLARGPGGRANH